MAAAGLTIEEVAEPRADEQPAAAHPEVADTRIAPHVLIVGARKPSRPSRQKENVDDDSNMP